MLSLWRASSQLTKADMIAIIIHSLIIIILICTSRFIPQRHHQSSTRESSGLVLDPRVSRDATASYRGHYLLSPVLGRHFQAPNNIGVPTVCCTLGDFRVLSG
jgi:hypothetical protein